MKKIRQCDECKNDGKCQYQDLDDCQCCGCNIREDDNPYLLTGDELERTIDARGAKF